MGQWNPQRRLRVRAKARGRSRRGVLATLAMLAVVLCARVARAQDDWQVIERHTTSQAPAAAAPVPPRPPYRRATARSTRAANRTPRRASLTRRWSRSSTTCGAPISRCTNRSTPALRTRADGGCIFYNQKFLDSLFQQWMRIEDPDAVKPMLYAIFAHEIGHLAHSDFDPASVNVPIKSKELSADQFAGYSLERNGDTAPRSGRSNALLPAYRR